MSGWTLGITSSNGRSVADADGADGGVDSASSTVGAAIERWARMRNRRTGLHTPATRSTSDRVLNACLCCLSGGVLGIARWLVPNASGYGTHTQLGLSPCEFFKVSGIPCPACGMTTSFAFAAHGRFIEAFTTQPAGATLAILTTMVLIGSVYGMIRGRSLTPVINAVLKPVPIAAMATLVVAAWVYKIHVVFGMHAQ